MSHCTVHCVHVSSHYPASVCVCACVLFVKEFNCTAESSSRLTCGRTQTCFVFFVALFSSAPLSSRLYLRRRRTERASGRCFFFSFFFFSELAGSGAQCVCLAAAKSQGAELQEGGEAAAVAPPLFLAKSHDCYISPFFLL